MKKKISAVLLVVLAICLAFSLSACDLFKPNNKPNEVTEKTAYISLDINPAIELIVDKDNNVISVRGENEDGQVLLYNEEGIVGEKIDKAIDKITELAVKYGYLDKDNSVVDTIVTSGDNAFASEILSKVNTSITATATNLGLSVTTDGEGAYSLLRKMEEIKKQFPNNAAIQNMTVQKFKLALSVSETGEISLDAAIALDDTQLIDMLKEASAKIEEYATDAYLQAKTKALAMYSEVTEIAGYSVYTKYYLDNLTKHISTAYYGGIYQMYASSAVGFGTICEIAQLTAKVENYSLDDNFVNEIVNIFGLSSADMIANKNGKVTISSIEAYADKLFKNTPVSQQLENTKKALSEALERATITIKQKVAEITAEYRPKLESALASAKNILTIVDSMFDSLPEAIKNFVNGAEQDLKDVLSEVEKLLNGDKINLLELQTLTNRLDVKAKEYYNKIKADLSEEEWLIVENLRCEEIAKYTQQKTELELTLNRAAQEAKDYLADLKAQRLTK